MKSLISVLVCFPLSLVMASDALLRNAIREERSLDEIGGRLFDIREKQEESNVFGQGEIQRTGKQNESVREIREEHYSVIIGELEKTSGKTASGNADYARTKDSYQDAADMLNEAFKEQGLKRTLDNRDLLQRQQELNREREALEEALEEQDNMTDEDLERFAEMAEKQQELSNDAEAELQQKMEAAAEALQELDLPEAQKLQEEITQQLEQQLEADLENMPAEMAEMLAELNQMDERLQQMLEQLENQQLTDEQRQQMAMEMAELAEQMQENELAEAAEDMNQAIEELMQPNDEQAQQEMQQAQQKVQQQQQQLAQQLQQQMPQEAPQEANESQELADSMDALQFGPRGAAGAGQEWSAGLPEKERSALLAARKAKFDPKMEEAVKRYFTELAK